MNSLEKDIDVQKAKLFEHYKIEVDPKQTLIRVDKFLMDRLPNATRGKIQEAIRNEFIQVNDLPTKSSYKIRPGDVITVCLPTPPKDSIVIPENIPLDIIYEDNHLLLVNKPAGMVVHPAYNNWSGTLVNALTFYFKNLPTMENNEGRPGLVHRIDKDTSGLLVIAKSEEAMSDLAKQFYHHSIERTYYALVWGEPAEDEGVINVNLGRDPKDRKITKAFPESDLGKRAVTHFKVLRRFRYVTLIQCNLETGRTHQIRAHMKYLKHPLFNDSTYGGDKILKGVITGKYKAFIENCFEILSRQALHAKSLGFIHPISKKFMQFDSPLPDDFVQVLDKFEHYVKYH